MEIKIKQLNKTFHVKPTNKVMRKVFLFERDQAKFANNQSKKPEQMFEDMANSVEANISFLKMTLGLTKAQSEKIEDWEAAETANVVNYVASRLMGMSDEEIAKDQGTAPKELTGSEESGN